MARARSCSSPGDRRLELVDRALRPRPRLGVAALPPGVLAGANRLLDRPHAALDPVQVAARHLAGRLPAVLDVAQPGLRLLQVGDRDERLGLLEKRLLDLPGSP